MRLLLEVTDGALREPSGTSACDTICGKFEVVLLDSLRVPGGGTTTGALTPLSAAYSECVDPTPAQNLLRKPAVARGRLLTRSQASDRVVS